MGGGIEALKVHSGPFRKTWGLWWKTRDPSWECWDPKSCASPGNGKLRPSVPLHYKNDTCLVLVIKILRSKQVSLTIKRIRLSSEHLKPPFYACSQNEAKKGAQKQTFDCIYHISNSNWEIDCAINLLRYCDA